MKRAAFPLAILAALVTGFASSQLVSTATAQTPTSTNVSCAFIPAGTGKMEGNTPELARGAEAWMRDQYALMGRRNFVVTGQVFCAW